MLPPVQRPPAGAFPPAIDTRPPASPSVAALAGPEPAAPAAIAVKRTTPPFGTPSISGYRPPLTLRETWWVGPAPGRGPAVPFAVLLGALGWADFVPLTRTGIGWVLAGLTMVVAILAGVWRSTGTLARTERWLRLGWTVSALALLSVLTFRNAWWLVTFSVLGALGCATLAIVGGKQIRSILFGLVATPFAGFRGLPWVSRHLRRESAPTGMGQRTVWTLVVTGVLLLVFGALLASADAVFSHVLGDLVPDIDSGTVTRWLFLFVFGGLLAVAGIYTVAAPPDLSSMDKGGPKVLGLLEWGLPVGGLVVLFSGFVAVQFTVLFGGSRHVLVTEGLSYAEYARSGFWQLSTVTVLTLAVLAGVARWAKRDTTAQRNLLRIMLGLICVLSMVIVASALYRMYTYQQAYSFTGERVFIMSFELLLGSIFLLIMAAGIRWNGSWIPQISVGLTVVLLLTLAVLNPEDYVARRNIERYQQVGKIDAWYLRALSADATPALTQLPDPVRRCVLSWINRDLKDPDPWYGWNLGRQRARDALGQLPPGAIGGSVDCHAADQFDFR
jgi:hypothetical protein